MDAGGFRHQPNGRCGIGQVRSRSASIQSWNQGALAYSSTATTAHRPNDREVLFRRTNHPCAGCPRSAAGLSERVVVAVVRARPIPPGRILLVGHGQRHCRGNPSGRVQARRVVCSDILLVDAW